MIGPTGGRQSYLRMFLPQGVKRQADIKQAVRTAKLRRHREGADRWLSARAQTLKSSPGNKRKTLSPEPQLLVCLSPTHSSLCQTAAAPQPAPRSQSLSCFLIWSQLNLLVAPNSDTPPHSHQLYFPLLHAWARVQIRRLRCFDAPGPFPVAISVAPRQQSLLSNLQLSIY